ncbi:MAG: glycoside hydrolase family 28 protein, partial [Gorillibacterium sp.]|nr:glycoside hydrolase family 28 protein [Gorillibacterium sp.]
SDAVPITESTPIVEGIHISGITATGCRSAAGFFYGLPEMPIRDVRLSDVSIQMTTDLEEPGAEPDMVAEQINMAGDGIWCRHVEDMEFLNVRVNTRQGPALRLEHASRIEAAGITTRQAHENTPIVEVIQSEQVTLSEAYVNH